MLPATYPRTNALNCEKPFLLGKKIFLLRRSVCKKNATYFASVADGFIYILCDAKCSLNHEMKQQEMDSVWLLHDILSSIYSFTPWRKHILILIPELNTHHERHAEDLQVSGDGTTIMQEVHSVKLTNRPGRWKVGRLVFFWEGRFFQGRAVSFRDGFCNLTCDTDRIHRFMRVYVTRKNVSLLHIGFLRENRMVVMNVPWCFIHSGWTCSMNWRSSCVRV